MALLSRPRVRVEGPLGGMQRARCDPQARHGDLTPPGERRGIARPRRAQGPCVRRPRGRTNRQRIGLVACQLAQPRLGNGSRSPSNAKKDHVRRSWPGLPLQASPAPGVRTASPALRGHAGCDGHGVSHTRTAGENLARLPWWGRRFCARQRGWVRGFAGDDDSGKWKQPAIVPAA